MEEELKELIRTIPYFPEKGIMFRDLTTLLQNGNGFKKSIDGLVDILKDVDFDFVVGGDARGFIFASPIAYKFEKGLVLARKVGKLPCETISAEFELEYGKSIFEMHVDSIKPGDKVVVVDDLLATGGTANAICELVEKLGGEVVKVVFVIELLGLDGRQKLSKYSVESLVKYSGK